MLINPKVVNNYNDGAKFVFVELVRAIENKEKFRIDLFGSIFLLFN